MLPSALKGLSSALAPAAKSDSIAGMVAKDEFDKYMGRRRGPENGKVNIKQDKSRLETIMQFFEACATVDERRILPPFLSRATPTMASARSAWPCSAASRSG
mmetsp:Transcript_40906/g.92055  ORF Transcript_40906/g.92055 Transcript_40906/m.92055 type:complete len:102 (+) Transcript_40906:382-687(+)